MIQSVVEQKMAIAAYGADGPIPVLTASQLDIATKVINILSPIKEITRNISAEFSLILQDTTCQSPKESIRKRG